MGGRYRLIVLTLLVLWIPGVVRASGNLEADPDLFLLDASADYVCPTSVARRAPARCPAYSPGARKIRLDYLRARLPDPMPALPVEEMEVPEDAISEYTFAYVSTLPSATYAHPEEAAAGLPPMREFLAGDNWVSVQGELVYNDQTWYEINDGEFVLAEHVSLANPSRFHGMVLNEQPQYAFGWINRDVWPSAVPGGEAREDALFRRYERITLFAQERLGDEMWYMVGPDQWVEQSYTSRVDVDPRPEGVAPGEKWIEVNTYEQTLAAYEGDRMVFATLISSGRSSTWTPNGLNRIWGKLPKTPMRNRDVGSDDAAWYYLEDVEWTQYFDGAYAIHAAYWHNAFSFTRSHGCVNLAPLDAKWLFAWTSPHTPEDAKVVYSDESGEGAGTWVWVHKTSPFPEENVESAGE